MRAVCFHLSALALLVPGLTVAGLARAQEPGSEASPAAFEPRFIDAGAYRDGQVLLYDWPALTGLVRWTAPVAEAVARSDGTLPAELLQEFRERVALLAASEPPGFMTARRDSVGVILRAVEARLDRAESMLAEALTAEIAAPTGGDRPNVSNRDRTYATGPTAVRVPAGVDVGDADSLPGAELGESGGENYVDLVSAALDELDALVHLVRKVGESASGDPGRAAPRPSPDTAPPRRAP